MTKEKLKITVTSADGEPSFIVKEGTPIDKINKYIKEHYGVIKPEKRGQAFKKHEWISQKATPTEHLNLLQSQKIAELEEEVDREKTRNRELKKAIKNLEHCLTQAYTRICYIDRTQNFDWVENHPSKIDAIKGEERAKEIVIRLGLEQIEKELGFENQ